MDVLVMNRKKTVGLLAVTLVAFFSACAEKPKTKVANGELANLYKKSDLVGKAHSASELNDKIAMLTKGLDLGKANDVSFTVSKKYLTIYAGKDVSLASTAVRQFEIAEHWDLKKEKNKDGEETQYLVKNKNANANWQARAYIEVDPYDPKKIVAGSLAGTRQGRVLDKNKLDKECFSVKENPIAEVAAVLKAKGIALNADQKICYDISQTILSVSLQSGESKDLLFTYDILAHLDADLSGESVDGAINPDSPENTWDKRRYLHLATDKPHFVENTSQANALEKSAFSGEWVYVATVVGAHSENGVLFEGSTTTPDSRIRFEFAESVLTAYKTSDSVNTSNAKSPLLRYVATHFDVQRKRNEFGDQTNLVEESVTRPWENRKNVRVDFAHNEVVGYFNDALGFEKLLGTEVVVGKTTLVSDVKVEEGLISYDTEEVLIPNLKEGSAGRGESVLEPTSVRIRHSFLRVDSRSYVAKEYSRKEFDRFGFFWTTKFGLDSDNQPTDQTLKHFVGRHDLDGGKKLVFALNNDWPEEYLDEAQEVVASWNKTLKQALSREDDVMVLDSKKSSDYGDPRSNMLVWISARSLSAPMGYGPSIADAKTGEIISSKAYMYGDAIKYVRRMAGDYYDLIKGKTPAEFEQEEGRPANLPIVLPSDPFNTDSTDFTNAFPKNLHKWHETAQAITIGRTDVVKGLEKALAEAPANISSVLDQKVGKAFRVAANFSQSIAKANTRDRFMADRMQGCEFNVDEHIASAIEYVKANSNLSKEELLDKLDSLNVYSTLLHEVGHNLGLRHNFQGSYDEMNFHDEYFALKALVAAGQPLPQGQYPESYRTSSIMDYNDTFEALAKKPGKYDEAAIKYVYGDLLEEEVGVNEIGVTISRDIKRSDVTADTKLREYKFCTDGNVENDPTCNRFDRGITVSEITQSWSDQYDTDYILTSFRRGKRDFQATSNRTLTRLILPTRHVLDELFYKLIKGDFEGQSQDGEIVAGNFADYVRALNIGLNFYMNILGSIEPGEYHFDESLGEFVSGRSDAENAKNLVVGPDIGKYLATAFDTADGPWEGSERVLRRGVEFDKLAVMYALGLRGYPGQKYDRINLAANYFNVAKSLVIDTYSKFMRDAFDTTIKGVLTEGGKFQAVSPDFELPEGVAPQNVIEGKIKSSTSLLLKINSMIFASLNYNSSADRTFGDYIDFRVKGVDDGSIPENTEKVSFTSINGLRTYVVPQTRDQLSVSFAVAKDAPAKSAEHESLLKQQAELEPGVVEAQNAAFDAVFVAFEKIWLAVQGQPLSPDQIAAIQSDKERFLALMLQIVGQMVAASQGNQEVLDFITLQTATYTDVVAKQQELAAKLDAVSSRSQDLGRELVEVESALLELKSIYEIFN